jgi:HAD superfamily hydrolase (TIGR01459 family)
MPTTKFCLGISDISDSYTGFIIDTWGVLHNGHHAHESAIECLRELKARNKYVMLLSNTEERADEIAAALKAMGIDPSLYNSVITSGELLWQGLKHQNTDGFQNLGTSCYLIGGERTRNFLKSIPIDVVNNIADAGFLVIAGWDQLDMTPNAYDDILREAVRRRLKTICVTPDSRALMGMNYTTGTNQITRRLQEFGGVIHFIGKPYRPIFMQAIKTLHQNDIYPGQTVMVGDAMAHDILGASLVNMDTCLVRDGMHAGLFRPATTPGELNKLLNMLIAQYNHVKPTYLVDKLKWGRVLPDRKHKKRK